jgi:septum formation protein
VPLTPCFLKAIFHSPGEVRVPPLILASTSAYRRELLARLGTPFEAIAPQVPEPQLPGEDPAGRAKRLAVAKAQAVSKRHPKAVVIGSDQVAACAERLLEKPGEAARCREQLAHLSGRSAQFYTACAVVVAGGRPQVYCDTTTVKSRTLESAEIERYVAREQPFECAGGFKAEALGITLIERIESHDPTALIGLPLIWLAHALRGLGCQLP